MSRVGKKPISIPSGVSVEIAGEEVVVTGARGELRHTLNQGISVQEEDGSLVIRRESDARGHRALHGLTRALLANMVTGVSDGFTRTMELVGYRVQAQGNAVNMQLGFSHPVVIEPMDGVVFEVEGVNRIHVRGIDKQIVGEQAARLRRLRPPDSYKGKGVRYMGERVRLKPGKSAAKRS